METIIILAAILVAMAYSAGKNSSADSTEELRESIAEDQRRIWRPKQENERLRKEIEDLKK